MRVIRGAEYYSPLIYKVDNLTQTAVCRDSNTHMEIFGDHSDIFYPQILFHMKHLVYVRPAMNSCMVSLKYDFEEFQSKHWLCTDSFADICVNIPIISNLTPRLHFSMSKILGVVKWIIRESNNGENKFPQTKTLGKDLITPKDACLYLNTMYYNNSLNIHDCVQTFKHQLQNDTWSFYTYTSSNTT